MNRELQALIVAALLAIAPVTNAAPVFFEDFEGASGTVVITGPFGATEREAGSYLSNVTVPGWALSVPGNTFVHEGLSGNTSVLLNGGGISMSHTVAGLTAGLPHQLTFEYWGDNEGLGAFQRFHFDINGTSVPVARASTGLATGNFGTIEFDFTPTSDSTLLRFTETGGSGTVFDNIRIIAVTSAVPEPAPLALLALALGALAVARRRKSSEAH